jgi:hypothetical protein
MKLHANARTCPNSRRLMVERTASKWLARWRGEGEAGAGRTLVGAATDPASHVAAAGGGDYRVAAAADDRSGDRRGLSMALSTVSVVLRRVGLGKRSRLEPPEPGNRYEHRRPGGLLHLDVRSSAASTARATASLGSEAASRDRRRGGAGGACSVGEHGRYLTRTALRATYSGMFPCLRFGMSTRFVCSVSSARISLGRVSCGMITSSM